MIIKLPYVRINTPSGDIDDVFNPTSISFSGSIFDQGQANISGVEKKDKDGKFLNIWDIGGLWKIYFGTDLVWQGYSMPFNSDRKREVMKRSFSLVDVTEAWNVLLTNTVYSSTDVGSLIADLASGAASASGIGYDFLVSDATALSTLFEAGKYVVTNSTYLAELNKILLWMGYKLYADPQNNKISVISPITTTPFGTITLTPYDDDLISASFDIDPTNIPTTVVVGDDVSGKAVSYGHLGDTVDNTNYDLRKLEKVAFVMTSGVKDAELGNLAKKVFDLGRKGAQKLTIVKAGYFTESILWKKFNWVDANGNLGIYKIISYKTDINGGSLHTTIEAIL